MRFWMILLLSELLQTKQSNRLLDKIIDVSLNVSLVNASDILKNGIADVGKSTICNLLKKRYTHRIIDLLPSREIKDVTKWLISLLYKPIDKVKKSPGNSLTR